MDGCKVFFAKQMENCKKPCRYEILSAVFFEVRNLYIKKMKVSDLLGLCEPICKLIDAVSKYIFVSDTFV